MKSTTHADVIRLIDDRILALRKDLEMIKLSQFAKSEAIDELLKIREELEVGGKPETALEAKLAGIRKTRQPAEGEGVS